MANEGTPRFKPVLNDPEGLGPVPAGMMPMINTVSQMTGIPSDLVAHMFGNAIQQFDQTGGDWDYYDLMRALSDAADQVRIDGSLDRMGLDAEQRAALDENLANFSEISREIGDGKPLDDAPAPSRTSNKQASSGPTAPSLRLGGASESGTTAAFGRAANGQNAPSPLALETCTPEGTGVRAVLYGLNPDDPATRNIASAAFKSAAQDPAFLKDKTTADWDALSRRLENDLGQPPGTVNVGGMTVRKDPACAPVTP